MPGEAAATQTPSVNDLRGFKRLRRVAGLLPFLHESGCARVPYRDCFPRVPVSPGEIS